MISVDNTDKLLLWLIKPGYNFQRENTDKYRYPPIGRDELSLSGYNFHPPNTDKYRQIYYSGYWIARQNPKLKNRQIPINLLLRLLLILSIKLI